MPDLLLGMDIGGTKTAFVLADTDGAIRARYRRPTGASDDARRDVDRMLRDAARLLEDAGATPRDVAAVGVSVPGPIDPERGLLLRPPNLPGWREVPIRDWLAEAFGGCRVGLENDANAAALAEWRFGAARGYADCVFLTMSTGVGGGLVLGGRLHRGGGGAAGEVGHIPVEWDGERCACGQRGCLEAYVGGAAWTRRLRACTPPSSRAAVLAGGAEQVLPEHLVRAAREGDAFARAELERWNHYLARAITSLAFTLDPQVVVLGTIAVAAGEALCFAPLRAQVRARLWPGFAERLSIVPAALGDELPYRAAVCAALEAQAEPAGGR